MPTKDQQQKFALLGWPFANNNDFMIQKQFILNEKSTMRNFINNGNCESTELIYLYKF